MTAHHTSPSPYHVVPPSPSPLPSPPTESSPSVAPSKPPSNESPQSQPEPSKKAPSRRHWIIGGILLGAGLVSIIPVPYQVGGDVQLSWRESARQAVHPPIPAMVDEVLVQSGDRVSPGQPLIQLSSRELEREIADAQEKLAQAQQELALAEQEQTQTEAAVFEASVRQQVARNQAEQALRTMQQLDQGIVPPEIQQLQIERRRLEQQLQEIQTNIDRYQELYEQGAIALIRVEEQHSLYRNVERDLAVTAERMQLTHQKLQAEAVRELGNIDSQSASLAASQMILDANQRITAQQTIIADLEQRLQTLQADYDELVLTATTEGTVMTSDLDLLIGQEVRPDTTLLQIAELSQLTANVEIKEEDLDFVEVGAEVTFRPRQAKLETYDAHVEAIPPNVEADEAQQQRVATVRVVIDNYDERLRPGSSGYAKIFSEWTPLYKRVGREILKLIPEKFL